MAAKNDIFGVQWCEIVFDEKNKEYGAFQLRRIYPRNVIIAIICSILFFGFSLSAPLIVELLGITSDEDDNIKVVEVVNLADPPPIDKNEPPPPPVEPPPPLKTTIKFVAPVVVKDEEVTEEPPPSQEELKEVEVGVKTQEGDSSGVDLSLVEGNEVIDEDPIGQIFTIVEQMPEFPGGQEELFRYLQKNIKYPPIARENGITGSVFVQFVVEKGGNISDVKLLKGIGGGCDEEALRVVRSMPAWKSGKQNGKPVSVQYNLPIRFTIK